MNSATCNSILDFNTLPMLFLQHSSNPNQRGVKGIMLLFKGICVNTSNCNQQFHGTYMYLICFTFGKNGLLMHSSHKMSHKGLLHVNNKSNTDI